MTITAIALIAGGIILIGLGVVARSGKLTRQSVVGLRTKASMASDEAWEAAHEASADWVVGAGAVMLVGGAAVMMTDSAATGDVVALIAVAATLAPLMVAFRRGQAAAKSV